MNRSLFLRGLLALVGAALLRLWMDGRLVFFIHPSTNWMVAAAGGILLLLSVWGIWRPQGHADVTANQLAIGAVVATLLVFVPAAPLSARLAEQRQSANAAPVSRTRVTPRRSPATYTISEWLTEWSDDPTHQKYVGLDADVIGFVTKTGERTFVNRLLITCCAIDAQGVQMEFAPKDAGLRENDWVEVKGKIENHDGNPFIATSSLTRVPVPSDPYVY